MIALTRKRVLLIAAAFLFIPVFASAQSGGGPVSAPAASGASSYAAVSLTIPATVGIDVETDLSFTLTTGTITRAFGTPCGTLTVFPPPPGCTGFAYYAPASTATTTTASAIAGTGITNPNATDSIWLAVFSNSGSRQVSAQLDNTTSGNSPTATVGDTAIELDISGSNTNFTEASGPYVIVQGGPGASVPLFSTAASTGWARQDQKAILRFANGATFNTISGTWAHLTFTIQ